MIDLHYYYRKLMDIEGEYPNPSYVYFPTIEAYETAFRDYHDTKRGLYQKLMGEMVEEFEEYIDRDDGEKLFNHLKDELETDECNADIYELYDLFKVIARAIKKLHLVNAYDFKESGGVTI